MTTAMSKILTIGAVCAVCSAQGSLAQNRTPTEPGARANLAAAPAIFGLAADVPLANAVAPASATNLAIAMGINPQLILSASLGTSDPTGAGVSTSPLGDFFPTQGDSFAILATGQASTAETVNDSGSTSGILSGLGNGQFPCGNGCDPVTGNDLVQLTLRLAVPSAAGVGPATCLAFDVAFYSEEFPEFVGRVFNDAFTAEIGGTDLSIVNAQIVAPKNFAFDTEGNLRLADSGLALENDRGGPASEPVEEGVYRVELGAAADDVARVHVSTTPSGTGG